MSALWALPARQREVLVLQYVADLPENQVAAAAGISEPAVRSQVALAFSALRADRPRPLRTGSRVIRAWPAGCALGRDLRRRTGDQGPCPCRSGEATVGKVATNGSTYMRASDAFTWYMERDPALRSTIVVIDWLDRAPDWDVLTERVDRISRLMPSLRQHVVESPFGITVPRWTYDPDFDLSWHLRRITAPPPGTRDAVLELARRSAMAAFDRARPLWEVTLVDGIEGGQAALIVKLHHSLSDGVGAMRMLAIVADWQREPADLGEMPPVPPCDTPDLLAVITGTVGSMAGRAVSLAWRGTAAAIPAWIRYARDPVGSSAAPWAWPVPSTGRPRRIAAPCHPSCGSGRRPAGSP